MKVCADSIDEFVEWVSCMETPSEYSVNQYKANTFCRSNLSYYLQMFTKIPCKTILVGEAPGRFGAYLTGVPFTDEYTMQNSSFFRKLGIQRSDNPQREITASVVWRFLDKVPSSHWPLMWNVYPFHPSIVGRDILNAESRPNRYPKKDECDMGLNILYRLIGLFGISRIIAVGRTSEKYISKDYGHVEYVRHPAHGGANDFMNKMKILLK